MEDFLAILVIIFGLGVAAGIPLLIRKKQREHKQALQEALALVEHIQAVSTTDFAAQLGRGEVPRGLALRLRLLAKHRNLLDEIDVEGYPHLEYLLSQVTEVEQKKTVEEAVPRIEQSFVTLQGILRAHHLPKLRAAASGRTRLF